MGEDGRHESMHESPAALREVVRAAGVRRMGATAAPGCSSSPPNSLRQRAQNAGWILQAAARLRDALRTRLYLQLYLRLRLYLRLFHEQVRTAVPAAQAWVSEDSRQSGLSEFAKSS